MGWKDREYNADRENMQAYLGNTLGLVQFAIPIFKSPRLTITLTFWFLLFALFQVIEDMRAAMPGAIPLDLAVLLGAVLWHEWGHRVFARWVGGNHWEWVLWPLGGMVPPSSPRSPWPVFVSNVGGLAFSLILLLATIGCAMAVPSVVIHIHGFGGNPDSFTFDPGSRETQALLYLLHGAGTMAFISTWMILLNLFPCYWFDGAHIYQAMLWPKLGQWRAVRIVCMAGMILAIPLFALSLINVNLLGMLMWAMVFADCFRRRMALAQAGPGVMDEGDGPNYNYMDPPAPARKKKHTKRWFGTARKRALKDQAEQAKIDAILAKVHDKGMHSLNWWEKRTLKKATERQRQRDLAERL